MKARNRLGLGIFPLWLHTALVPVLFLTAVASFLLSLLGKALADHFLAQRVSLLGSFVGLERSFNPGIAFGILLPWHLRDVIVGAALVLVCVLAFRSGRSILRQAAFGLIIGGAFTNIVDRFSDGVVTDFFQVGTFPIFNVADSCITVGVILLLIEALWGER